MKFKSIKAILVAGIMVVSVPMVAMAEDIKVQINDSNVDTYATNGVISNNITVKGAVTVKIDTKDVKIDGNVTEGNNGTTCWAVVRASGEGSGNVEVTGNVTNEGYGVGVGASGKHTVNIGGAITTNTNYAIEASKGATVTAGSVEAGWDGVTASGNSTVVVNGDIDAINDAIYFSNKTNKGGTVTVLGKVDGDTYNVAVDDTSDKTYRLFAYEIEAENGLKFAQRNYGEHTSDDSIKDSIKDQVFYIVKTSGLGDIASLTDKDNNQYTTTVDEKTYYGVQASDTNGYTVRVTEVPGYVFMSMSSTKGVLTANGDGTYTLIVPEGGGVSLELVYAMIKQAEDDTPVNTGSVGAAVNGTWTQNFKGEWFFTSNRQVKNSWAYIADPTGAKEGNFYRFGENGAMLTGWQLIDGKWYYFNETPGADLGKLLVNGVTPDGKRVGADGARID